MKFFLDAGIPPDSSAQYAVTFETNRMGLDMLMDLDKEYLRDLNITALGDIISILKHAKGASAKKAADEVLLSDIDNSSQKQTTIEKSKDIKKPKSDSLNVKKSNRKESFVLTKRLGLQLPESDSDPPSPALDINKSVFSRLGDQQSDDSEVDAKDSVPRMKSNSPVTGKRSSVGGSGSIFERLGPESERMGREKMELSPQEARVTSTTSITPDSTNIPPTRGILKKRGTGDGAGLVKSKSASNIISLKPPTIKDLKKKRISFGENEIKTMEPKPDIKSRLGYGKCSSPPPPEISEPSLKTEIKKIAIGGGRFEMRKVMKVVNADKTIASELGRHSEGEDDRAGKSPELMENLSIAVKNEVKPVRKQLQVAIKNNYANTTARKKEYMDEVEYKVDKVDLALRAAKLKVARNQAKATASTDSVPRKRLAKYETKADGTVEKQYISYDDPILDVVPIKKAKSEELDQMIQKTEQLKMKSLGKSPVKITKDRMATNFQVVRHASSSNTSQSTHVTLAQKAVMARSKQESFQTLASRATSVQQKRSHSPEEKSMKSSGAKMDERKPSLKARLDESTWRREETRASKSPNKSIQDRMGSRDRVSSMDRSPVSLKDRIGSRERSQGSERGSSERSPGRSDSSRQRLGSSGDKKIFSRLGPRESL